MGGGFAPADKGGEIEKEVEEQLPPNPILLRQSTT